MTVFFVKILPLLSEKCVFVFRKKTLASPDGGVRFFVPRSKICLPIDKRRQPYADSRMPF